MHQPWCPGPVEPLQDGMTSSCASHTRKKDSVSDPLANRRIGYMPGRARAYEDDGSRLEGSSAARHEPRTSHLRSQLAATAARSWSR